MSFEINNEQPAQVNQAGADNPVEKFFKQIGEFFGHIFTVIHDVFKSAIDKTISALFQQTVTDPVEELRNLVQARLAERARAAEEAKGKNNRQVALRAPEILGVSTFNPDFLLGQRFTPLGMQQQLYQGQRSLYRNVRTVDQALQLLPLVDRRDNEPLRIEELDHLLQSLENSHGELGEVEMDLDPPKTQAGTVVYTSEYLEKFGRSPSDAGKIVEVIEPFKGKSKDKPSTSADEEDDIDFSGLQELPEVSSESDKVEKDVALTAALSPKLPTNVAPPLVTRMNNVGVSSLENTLFQREMNNLRSSVAREMLQPAVTPPMLALTYEVEQVQEVEEEAPETAEEPKGTFAQFEKETEALTAKIAGRRGVTTRSQAKGL